jgi:phosphoglycolate phosphatase-like HAD superfamily hydrolase
VVTREHCLNRVEQLKIAAEKLRVSLNSVLFIGDTDNDLFAAKKVGCHFLRVKDEDLV